MNIKKIYRKGAGSVVCGIAAAMMALPVLTSCEDFFTQESDDVLYADQNHLNVAEGVVTWLNLPMMLVTICVKFMNSM